MNLPDALARELAAECRNRAAVQLVLCVALHDADGAEPMSRARIAELTGMAKQSISLGLEYAIGRGWLCYDSAPKRKRRAYHINWKVYLLDFSSDNKGLSIRTLENTTNEGSSLPDAKSLIDRPLETGTAVATQAGELGTYPESRKHPLTLFEGAAALPPAAPETAGEIYRRVNNRSLPVAIRAEFEGALVRAGPVALEYAVRCWIAAGFKPTNYKGQLDWIRKGVPERWQLESTTDYEAGQAGEVIEIRRGSTNGHEPKTFQQRRDELNIERLDIIDRLIDDELAGGAGGSLAAAPARGRLGDPSQSASGGGKGSAGGATPPRSPRYLG